MQPEQVVRSDTSASLLEVAYLQWSGDLEGIRNDITKAVLKRSSGLPGRRGEQTLPAVEASPHLTYLHDNLLAWGRRIVDQHSPLRWLWYLRRLPGLFTFNDNPTTAPYCRVLAESLTAMSKTKDTERPGRSDEIRFPAGKSDIRQILKLETLIGLLYETHSASRWCGKGADMRFRPDGLPEPVPDPELSVSVSRYDERHADSFSLLAQAGLYANHEAFIWDADDFRATAILFVAESPVTAVLPMSPNNVYGFTHAEGRFPLGLFDLASVPILGDASLDVDTRWPRSLVLAVTLMASCLHPVFLEDGYANTAVTGYSIVLKKALKARIDFAISYLNDRRLGGILDGVRLPKDAEEVIAELSEVEGSVWPPRPGSPIRPYSEKATLVDVRGGSFLLFDSLSRTIAGGPDVNKWADTFESQVQTIVDASPWRPPAHVRDLQGREVRAKGRTVTDIDAIGADSDRLLVVSCKSVAFTDALDRGDYNAIRNLESLIDEELTKWKSLVEILSNESVKSKYGLVDFREIVGAIVFPFTPFTRLEGAELESTDGLRWVLGASEFYDWIMSD